MDFPSFSVAVDSVFNLTTSGTLIHLRGAMQLYAYRTQVGRAGMVETGRQRRKESERESVGAREDTDEGEKRRVEAKGRQRGGELLVGVNPGDPFVRAATVFVRPVLSSHHRICL